jgi:hypothetical protein
VNFDVTVYPDGSIKIDFGTWALTLDDDARVDLRYAMARPCSQGAKRTTGPFDGVRIDK